MNKRITFRGTEHSPVIEEHVQRQLAKIEHFLEHDKTPQSIDFIIEIHPTHAHNRIDIQIKSPSYHVKVTREGQEVYRVIDEVTDAAYRELQKEKERNIDRRQGKQGPHRP